MLKIALRQMKKCNVQKIKRTCRKFHNNNDENIKIPIKIAQDCEKKDFQLQFNSHIL